LNEKALRFKFSTVIEDEPLLRTDYKTTVNGRDRCHVTNIGNYKLSGAVYCYRSCLWGRAACVCVFVGLLPR